MKKNIAVYPGSFDPITNGHLDVIERGAKLFDNLRVAVAINIGKDPLFDLETRCHMIEKAVQERGIQGVQVCSFTGMLVSFMQKEKIRILLRGIRTLSDWENEFQMALTNRTLAPEIETVYVMASLEYSYVSSRLIREIAALGGEIEKFVPPIAADHLKNRARTLLKDR